MLKYTLAATLLIASTVGFANDSSNTEMAALDSVRNFPVIVKNEVLASGVCKLHFEDGRTKQVSCNETPQPETNNSGLASL